MANDFDEMKANSAIMPKRLSLMFARLSLRRAKCARIDCGTGKPPTVPECHIIIGYGTGTAAGTPEARPATSTRPANQSGQDEAAGAAAGPPEAGKQKWEPSFFTVASKELVHW